jgi:hypothetical protein
MDEAERAVREILRTQRAKNARRAVSKKLALYHQSLVDALSGDTNSFFERVLQEAERDISAHRGNRPIAQGRGEPTA